MSSPELNSASSIHWFLAFPTVLSHPAHTSDRQTPGLGRTLEHPTPICTTPDLAEQNWVDSSCRVSREQKNRFTSLSLTRRIGPTERVNGGYSYRQFSSVSPTGVKILTTDVCSVSSAKSGARLQRRWRRGQRQRRRDRVSVRFRFQPGFTTKTSDLTVWRRERDGDCSCGLASTVGSIDIQDGLTGEDFHKLKL